MDYNEVMQAAEKHVNRPALMQTSAASCLKDARAAVARGDEKAALMWARRSLLYSVGAFHPDYQESLG